MVFVAFAAVGRYSKPQPSLMPDHYSTLRTIAPRPKYIIKSDLTRAFYQIPLSKTSKKACHLVSRRQGVHKIRHGNAWLRDHIRRINVSRPGLLHAAGLRSKAC